MNILKDLSAVARYCCRADEVETSAVFDIFMLVDVNGTKSHAVYDISRQLEEVLASMHTTTSRVYNIMPSARGPARLSEQGEFAKRLSSPVSFVIELRPGFWVQSIRLPFPRSAAKILYIIYDPTTVHD